MKTRYWLWCWGLVGALLSIAALTDQASAQTWLELSPAGGPPQLVNYQPTVVLDPATDRLILYGRKLNGENEAWVLSDANGLNGTPTWMKLSPSGASPPNTGNHSAVYDSVNNRMIVFGGCMGQCLPVSNQVWVLTNANGLGSSPQWIQLSPSGSVPAPRHAAAAGYDQATNTMVIFGGHNGSGWGGSTYSDVWVLSNANGLEAAAPVWTKLYPQNGPPPGQYAPSSVYDSSNKRLIVVGGSAQGTGALTNAAWVLNNATGSGTPSWTKLIPEGAPGSPSPFMGQPAYYDAIINRMMLVSPNTTGFDLWRLSNANGLETPPTWTQTIPNGGPPTGGAGQNMAVYDPGSNRATVLFFTAANNLAAWVLTDANGIVDVTIDIKPGATPNSINLGSGGVVPVAILSSSTFDATTVDPTTVTLASAPAKMKGNGTPMASNQDVNDDGLVDLVIQVSTSAFQLNGTDTMATLEGKTFEGTAIRGSDTIRIVQ